MNLSSIKYLDFSAVMKASTSPPYWVMSLLSRFEPQIDWVGPIGELMIEGGRDSGKCGDKKK